jgi:hypothetical protein
MTENKKKKITLSINKDVDEKLTALSDKFGMTRSGLVTFLINKLEEEGSIYK